MFSIVKDPSRETRYPPDRQALAAYLPPTVSIDDYPEIEESFVDRQGKPVDTRNSTWRLNNAFGGQNLVNWELLPIKNEWLLYATMFFLVQVLKTGATDAARGFFIDLRYMQHHYGGTLDSLTAEQLVQALPAYLHSFFEWCKQRDRSYRFARVRQWYCTLADLGFHGFDVDEAARLMELRVGGNPKGVAVLLHDPETGPLDPAELSELRGKLRRHQDEEELLSGIVLIWLHLALGSNPRNFSQLCEQDFVVKRQEGSGDTKEHSLYYLMVPRIKKRGTGYRSDFKQRPLNPEIGALVERLIASNRLFRPSLPEGVQRPIFFVRGDGRKAISGADKEFSFHMNTTALANLFNETVDRLAPMSHRTGGPMPLSARRLRRTFGTMAAASGISTSMLAELMDHTDEQNVQVYFEATGDIVRKLDLTYAEHLGRVTDLFMGRIEIPSVADRVSEKSILGLPRMIKISTIGRCRGTTPCGLAPPYSCYLCPSFCAFRDADHHAVLEALIEERDERFGDGPANAALDAQLGDTILACARVCHLIDSGSEA